MAEQRMSDLLAGLADPVQPDPEFREWLFESLVAEIDFEPGRRRGAARSTGWRWLHAHASTGLWIAFLVLLLLAALYGNAVVGRPPIVTLGPLGQLDPNNAHSIPVVVDTGTIPDGLQLGPVERNPETATVSGPDSVVKRVVAAVAYVTIDPHGLSVDRNVPLIAVDNQVNELRPVNVNPKTVHVTINVISTAGTKTIVVDPNITGTPPDGYQIGSVTVNPISVTVMGDPGKLSSLTRANTVPISVATSTGTINSNFALDLPSGVAAVGTETVHVTVEVQVTRSYDAALLLIGRRIDLNYSLSPGSVVVALRGPVADLDQIDPSTFTVYVDVAGLEPGAHQVQPEPALQSGITVISVDPETVTVTVHSSGSPAPSATP